MKKENCIAVCRRITEEKTARKINGIFVDLFTANIIVQVYDAVNDENKERLHSLDFIPLSTVCMKCLR